MPSVWADYTYECIICTSVAGNCLCTMGNYLAWIMLGLNGGGEQEVGVYTKQVPTSGTTQHRSTATVASVHVQQGLYHLMSATSETCLQYSVLW